MRYGHEESLRDWTTAIDFYERRNKLPRIPGKFEYKFMLVTSHEPLPGVTGQAWLGGEEAIASLSGRYTIIAHEYGHTLAATHEDAEVQWSSVWPCETNLISSTVALRSNCYRYSRKNERNIRVHMAGSGPCRSTPIRRGFRSSVNKDVHTPIQLRNFSL